MYFKIVLHNDLLSTLKKRLCNDSELHCVHRYSEDLLGKFLVKVIHKIHLNHY